MQSPSNYQDNRHDDITMDAAGEPSYERWKEEPTSPQGPKVAAVAEPGTPAESSEEPRSPKTPLALHPNGQLLFKQ